MLFPTRKHSSRMRADRRRNKDEELPNSHEADCEQNYCQKITTLRGTLQRVCYKCVLLSRTTQNPFRSNL